MVVAALDCGAFDKSEAPLIQRQWFTPFAFQFLWSNLPAVHGGLLMLAVDRGIAAFDLETGAHRWTARLFAQNGGASSDVVASNGRACIADTFGGSGCVDVPSGKVTWSAPPDSSMNAGIAIDESLLYYGTRDHRVVARSVVDGSVKWTIDVAPDAPFLTRVFGVTLDGNKLYASTVRWLNNNGVQIAGDLIALDPTTGRELWRFTPAAEKSGFQGAPVIAGNLIIVSDVYSHVLRAVDASTHEQVWQTENSASGYITAETPPAVSGDTIFAGSTDTQIHAIDVRTGVALWRVLARNGSLGSIALCRNYVLAVEWVDGALAAVDRSTMKLSFPRVLSADDLFMSRVMVAGDRAYVAGKKGVYGLRCAG